MAWPKKTPTGGGGIHGQGPRTAATSAQSYANKQHPINGGKSLPGLHGAGHRTTHVAPLPSSKKK